MASLIQKYTARIPLRGLLAFTKLHNKDRSICGSVSLFAGGTWREENGLPKCSTENGPLTDLPDWSYADGRPSPLNGCQRIRRLRHMEQTITVMTLLKEVELAEQTYANNQTENVINKQKIMDSKLKPKSSLL